MSRKKSSGDGSVGFLYKAMRERDPTKRRVKPVAEHLIEVNFDGDSDEDSDFDVEKHQQPVTDDESENSENDDSGDDKSEEEKDDKSETENDESLEEDESYTNEVVSSQSDEDDMEEEDSMKNLYLCNMMDDEDDDEDYVPKKKNKSPQKGMYSVMKGTGVSGEGKANVSLRSSEKREKRPPNTTKASTMSNVSTPTTGRLKVLVCCICLVDNSETEDEIVECDSCGACVHEGCYGVSDSQSTTSTDSSTSTEPWFCDSCKAGLTPSCELCPNTGGIFKETDTGKWVHLVCALYIPGIAFGCVEKLTPVTLFEMPYSKWGAKQCSLCEDSTLSSTGVAICCDAGMCRNYFHVTCAQMQGLLSQASIDEVHAIADPFFAYCKLHAEKGVVQAKRRNWLAVKSHMKKHLENKSDLDDKSKLRVACKLERYTQKYARSRAKRPPSWVPTTKMVRHLTSSPSAVIRMMKKAQHMGIITQVESGAGGEPTDVRKKSVLAPAFTPDYITYFIERSNKISVLRATQDQLAATNARLHTEERALREKYERMEADLEMVADSMTKLKTVATFFYTQLSDILGKTVTMPVIFRGIRSPKSPNRRAVSRLRDHIIHKCGICGGTHEQNMLARCDSCKRHLHLGCLQPPLTRMPKKTKLQGWQCSECMPSVSDDSDTNANIDMNAPRKLRAKVKGPRRFASPNQSSNIEPSKSERSLHSTKRTKRPSLKLRLSSDVSQPPVLTKESHYRSPSKSLNHSSHALKTKSVRNNLTRKTAGRQKSGFVRRYSALQRHRSNAAAATIGRRDTPDHSQADASSQTKVTVNLERLDGALECGSEERRTATLVCCVCNKPGVLHDSIRCDTCRRTYHYSCLSPPRKVSPKRCGYEWQCRACEGASSGESESSSNESEPPILFKEPILVSEKGNKGQKKNAPPKS